MKISQAIKNSEVYKRLIADTPIFFKKLRNFAMSIGALALTMWLANKELDLELPDTISNILRYILIVSIFVTGTSQLTRDNKNENQSG